MLAMKNPGWAQQRDRTLPKALLQKKLVNNHLKI